MIPKDAVTMKNWKRMERGLPPLPEPKIIKPEPTPPVVENQVRFDDLPAGEIRDISARIHHPPVRNKEGQIFVGLDLFVDVEKKVFQGWMTESDFFLLKKRIPVERIDLIRKISF